MTYSKHRSISSKETVLRDSLASYNNRHNTPSPRTPKPLETFKQPAKELGTPMISKTVLETIKLRPELRCCSPGPTRLPAQHICACGVVFTCNRAYMCTPFRYAPV